MYEENYFLLAIQNERYVRNQPQLQQKQGLLLYQ